MAGAVITLAVPFFLMRFNQDNHLETDQSLCPFKMLTGFPCPGCGITKSLVYFFQGDLYKSFYYHIFGPLLIVFCFVTILVLLVEIFSGKSYFDQLLFNKKLAYFLGFTLGIYHLTRLVYFVWTHSTIEILRESIWR